MELFKSAKTVRLRSHHDKYLLAGEDEEYVCQDRNGSSRSARWSVEFADGKSSSSVVRLKSCYGRYLAASDETFLLGMVGRKVLQSGLPPVSGGGEPSVVEWEPEPVRDGTSRVRLKSRHGYFLRANAGLPPWRNSVTHDIPRRAKSQDWVLWHVEILEVRAA
ncbi:uncharacterized protein M6B38_415105 [Iris pallida]|uniref:DUF569 domain-containing protein n=1 Tax=Iris pallida TaxID=29817 RepID=A0AAX6FJZ9_IRIPA|nr:uncharacterized protein M6B38_415105 [Iris pallida]